MALGGEIVNLVRLHLPNDADETARIAQIAVMERDAIEQMVDARCIGKGCAADNAMYGIALLKQELGKVAAVLSGDAGDKRGFHG